VIVLNRIRHRLTYANVVATLALFVALGGSAAAATHYLITSTHQISPGVRKALKGAKGKTGPRGQKGAAGLTGATGTPGAPGPKGDTGLTGTVDTSNFFTKTASDARYVQGSGSVTPIPLVSLANSASGGSTAVPGVGTVSFGLCSSSNSLISYTNTSAVAQDYILLSQYEDQAPDNFTPDKGTVAAGASFTTSDDLGHDILHVSVDLPRPTTWTITISRSTGGNCLYWGSVTSG
jgi:Collagen triple helix repeat (20 copies)